MDFRTGYCTRLSLILHCHDGDVASLSTSNPRIVYLGCILTTVSVYIKGSPDTSSGASNTRDDFGEDDMDLLQSPFNVETNSVDYAVRYRGHVLKPDGPPLRIYINRLQEEFASDVLTIYKKPNSGLCSSLRVKFENERGVGEGPVREFFSLLIGMVQNGFPLEESQLTLVFEGETDHKVPVPNALLCGGGFFKSAGRMMAHSFLHGGPPIYGISPAVVDYWCSDSIDSLTIEDVPDYELRQALIEVSCNFVLV